MTMNAKSANGPQQINIIIICRKFFSTILSCIITIASELSMSEVNFPTKSWYYKPDFLL